MHLVTSDFMLSFFLSFSCFLTENAGKFILDEMKHFQSYSQQSWHKIIWRAFLFFSTLIESVRIQWLMSMIILTLEGKLSKMLKEY